MTILKNSAGRPRCAAGLLKDRQAESTPADLLKPLKDSWPTYNGDYTGKRYSALAQINQSNVKHLTLAWMTAGSPGTRPRQADAAAGANSHCGR